MTIPPPVPYAALMSSQDAFARPPGRWHRSVPAWPNWRIDVLPAVLIGAFQVGLTNVAGRHQVGHQQLDPLGGTLLAIGALALIGRRRWPVATLGVALAATLTFVVLDYPNGPIWLPLIFALFNVMIRGYRLVAWGTLVLGYAAFMWLPYLVGAEAKPPSIPGAVGIGAWLLVLGSAAEIARIRRERSLEASRMRAEEARRRASEERLRIARELHDVLAHNISLINVQAGVALHLIDEQPEQARTALAAIKQASKEALGELRSVLDVLRRGHEGAPRAPQAGLEQLDELVGRAAAAGLSVHVQTDGTNRPLPAGVDLAAYRIVQEALTNVTRHAASTTATVRVVYGNDDLVVEIDDDGRGASSDPNGSGTGIRGMRERAAALGGELEAGPRPGGGFRVRASLPLRG